MGQGLAVVGYKNAHLDARFSSGKEVTMKRDKHSKSQSNDNAPFEYVNKRELMEKLEPLIDNTLMRFGLIPVEIELVRENHRWFLRIFIFSQERDSYLL